MASATGHRHKPSPLASTTGQQIGPATLANTTGQQQMLAIKLHLNKYAHLQYKHAKCDCTRNASLKKLRHQHTNTSTSNLSSLIRCQCKPISTYETNLQMNQQNRYRISKARYTPDPEAGTRKNKTKTLQKTTKTHVARISRTNQVPIHLQKPTKRSSTIDPYLSGKS